MNQKEIWCVVNPTVGLPLFLGAVATTSLIVHGAIMLNTDWYPAYYNGNQKAQAVSAAPAGANSVAPLALAAEVSENHVADVTTQAPAK